MVFAKHIVVSIVVAGGLFVSKASAEQKTVCCIDGAPQGFIRVGSTIGANSRCPSNNPQALNLCIYVRYDNLKSGDKLSVCADEPTPSGWNESKPFTKLAGCDDQKYSGSAKNEKVIQKK